MGKLRFRRATVDDLAAIVAMLADDELGKTREDASVPVARGYVDAFAAIDRSPDQLLAVAEDDAGVVGTLQITYLPGLSYQGMWRGQIEAVRIASRARGQGLGSEFVRWAIEQCRERGCGVVQLSSHQQRVDAHRFYLRLGFEQSHSGFKLKLAH